MWHVVYILPINLDDAHAHRHSYLTILDYIWRLSGSGVAVTGVCELCSRFVYFVLVQRKIRANFVNCWCVFFAIWISLYLDNLKVERSESFSGTYIVELSICKCQSYKIPTYLSYEK